MSGSLKSNYVYVASWPSRERAPSPARRWIAGFLGGVALLSVLATFVLLFITFAGLMLVFGAVAMVTMLVQRVLARGRQGLPESSRSELADPRWETIDVSHVPSR